MAAPAPRRRSGFTLLELLVVIGILAIIGGGLLVAYEGLEDDAVAAQDAFSTSAGDRALRTFNVLNDGFPNDWDSLLIGDHTATDFNGTELDRLTTELKARILDTAQLTALEATALNAVGITSYRVLSTNNGAANNYDNDSNFNDDNVAVPNRIFNDADGANGFYGVSVTFNALDETATVDTSTQLARLLSISATDKVVALGIGNMGTITDQSNNGAMSQVPFSKVENGEYGRYIALFHVSDSGGAFTEARLLGVIDAKGEILDENASE